MNDRTQITALTLSIAAVERDTGLSKDTLRVWERRYGFPAPGRDGIGERAYTLDQIDKLRLIKRLMDAGHRPGRIVALTFAELQALNDAMPPSSTQPEDGGSTAAVIEPYLALIRRHDAVALRGAMTRALSRLGVTRFIIDIVTPLNVAVGDAWLRGQLEVFEEHLYTEALQVVLRQAIAAIPLPPDDSRPRVLLSTFPGEPHGLGLLMAEAMFALEGCACLSLGVQTPLWDLSKAAAAHRTDIVALSFTGCMNPNQVVDSVTELRAKLPPPVQIWAGGAAPVLHRRRVAGVQAMGALGEIPTALMAWRVAHG